MASDFPRGWVLQASTQGSAVSLVIAGVPGITHVIDSIMAKIAGAPWVVDVAVFSVGNTFSHTLSINENTNGSSDEFSFSDLGLAGAPGEDITVKFNSGNAGTYEYLVVQGHDI